MKINPVTTLNSPGSLFRLRGFNSFKPFSYRRSPVSSSPRCGHKHAFSAVALSLLLQTGAGQETTAWRLDDQLPLAEGWSISGAVRSRFENADNSLRKGTENDQILTLRTRIDARYSKNGRQWQFEVMDSRQEFADPDGIVGTGNVNALDIQQASLKLELGSPKTSLKMGRFTTDYGSRRLIARPIYRNTFNAFDGFEFKHTADDGNQFALLATQPVQRLPNDKTP